MKSFPFFLLIIFFLSSADSTEIATFKISFVIDNSLEFDKFIDKLDTLRTKMQNDLLEDENEAVRLSAMNIMEIAPNVSMIPALQVVSILDKNAFIRVRAQELLRTFSSDETDSRVETKS